MKPIAYEGSEPYIFVSYAHRDADAVFAVLEELQAKGYRLWYDDGIAPGSEWPEDIARHLDAAAMVLAFITPNSMKSRNCRREINFSLSREKPFLSVVLEDTEMSLGMEMQLSAQQSIIRKNYDSWQGFIDKVLACPDLEPCQVVEPDEPVVELVREPVSEPDSSEPEYHEVELVLPEPEPVAVPESVPAPVAKPVPSIPAATKQEPPATSKTTAKPARPKWLIPVIALAVALIAFGISQFITASNRFSTSWDEEIKKDKTSLRLSGETLTQSDLKNIAEMPKLEDLALTDCDLSACDFAQVSFGESFDSLDLSGSKGISDYSFLSNLPLKELRLSGCTSFANLDVVNTDSLRYLFVDGTGVKDLTPVSGAGLAYLDFSDTGVRGLPLTNMASLEDIRGARTAVTDISALAHLKNLRIVDFSGCALTYLGKSTFESLSLKELCLADTGVTNLSAFSNCTVLEELDLSGNGDLADVSWLDKQNYKTLKRLYLARTGMDGDSLGWISRCKNLEKLTLDGIALKDLSCVNGLEKLWSISAVGCGIEDISGLSGSNSLTEIMLSFNRINDVAALAGLSFDSRVTLELTGNKLETAETLPAGTYQAVMLYGNDQNIALTLPDDYSMDVHETVVPYCKGIEKSVATDYHHYHSVYVIDCPQNRVLKLQDAFASSALELRSEDELWQMYDEDSFEYSLGVDTSYLVELATQEEDAVKVGQIAPVVPLD